MKRTLKSIFTILLICVVSISLAGCGKKNNSIGDKLNGIFDEIEKELEENNNEIENNKENEKGNKEEDDLKLYSDETKIVFNMQDIYYIIYYHNGNEITGKEYIYDYEDSTTAKLASAVIKAAYKDDETVEKAEVQGAKLRIVFKKEAYENETLESVKIAYSYLEEVKEN